MNLSTRGICKTVPINLVARTRCMVFNVMNCVTTCVACRNNNSHLNLNLKDSTPKRPTVGCSVDTLVLAASNHQTTSAQGILYAECLWHKLEAGLVDCPVRLGSHPFSGDSWSYWGCRVGTSPLKSMGSSSEWLTMLMPNSMAMEVCAAAKTRVSRSASTIEVCVRSSCHTATAARV